MPVSYTVSNVGQNYESPPRSRHEPGYYEPVNKSPYQNQNYYGPINRGSNQDQGYYRPINRGYYQDQTYYDPIKRSPYQNEGYNGPTNRSPYYQDLGYESDMSDNYQSYGQHAPHNYYDGYVDPFKSPGHGGYVINNPPQPSMPVLKEQSQISEIIEWKETPEAHVYKAYLPGVKRGEVELELEEDIGKVLNIKFYKGEEYSGQHVQEIHSIMLPDNANTGQVKANMEDGVLTVSVPKLTRSKKAYRMSI